MAEKNIEGWRKTLTDLNSRLVDCNASIEQLGRAKKPFALAAHTGDEKAKTKLAELNSAIRAAEQDAADISEAIAQAEANLSDAGAAKARKEEGARLREVRKIAEHRVELAANIEAKAQELAEVCEEFRALSVQMGRAGAWPVGDDRWKTADGSGRLLLALQRTVGRYLDSPANPLDPRIEQAFADIEPTHSAAFC